MGRLSERFAFVNFGSVCSDCRINCCKRFYAVLLPEEEKDFENSSFSIDTELGSVRAIGSRNGLSCPYLDDTGMCSIYVRRPLDCRLWPVILYYDFKTGEKVIYLDLDCPAVASGKLPSDLIKNVIEELKKLSLDIEWLKKYTLAPWPNHLIEVARIK
ncbi:MAG: YkgJ family cysteine cluster protein [Zestosphaera sp.]